MKKKYEHIFLILIPFEILTDYALNARETINILSGFFCTLTINMYLLRLFQQLKKKNEQIRLRITSFLKESLKKSLNSNII